MSLVVTTPLTIPQLLDRGFQLFKQVLPKVLPLTAVSALLSALPALLFAPDKKTPGAGFPHLGYFVLWMLAAGLANLSIVVAVIRKVDDIAEGRDGLTLAEAYRGGFRQLPIVLGALILGGFVMLLGFVLLLIPGFILMLSLSFTMYFIILENQRSIESLKNSHRLVWGHWWRWATIYTVAIALFMGIYVVMGVIGAAVGHTAGGGDTAALAIANFIVQVVVSAISAPLLYSVQLIGFRDLQLRKGGADLATRIAQAA